MWFAFNKSSKRSGTAFRVTGCADPSVMVTGNVVSGPATTELAELAAALLLETDVDIAGVE